MIPSKQDQIVQHHATLIVRVVQTCHQPELRSQLEPALKQSADNGWTNLVNAIHKILDGNRDATLLNGLDEEDHTIIDAILRGLQDPATLPDPDAQPDGSMAAAGLAGLVHAAGSGDVAALKIIGDMAEQMSQGGGDMAKIAAVIRPLVNGERDPDVLSRGMSGNSNGLLLAILEELAKLDTH